MASTQIFSLQCSLAFHSKLAGKWKLTHFYLAACINVLLWKPIMISALLWIVFSATQQYHNNSCTKSPSKSFANFVHIR